MSSWTKYGFFLCMVFYFGAAQDIYLHAVEINKLFEGTTDTQALRHNIFTHLNEDWYAIGVIFRVPGSELDVIQADHVNDPCRMRMELAQYISRNYEYTHNLLEKVEMNPLAEPSLQQAFLVARDVKKIYNLGLLLSVHKSQLDLILEKKVPLSQMKAEILHMWLKNASEKPTYQALENTVKELQMDKCVIMTVITRMYFTTAPDHWGEHQSDYAAAETELKTYAPVNWHLLGHYLHVPTDTLDEIQMNFTLGRYDSDRCLIQTVYSWITNHIHHGKKCDFHQLLKHCKFAKMIGNRYQQLLTKYNEMIAALKEEISALTQSLCKRITTALIQSLEEQVTEKIEKQNELIFEEISKTTALIKSLRKQMTKVIEKQAIYPPRMATQHPLCYSTSNQQTGLSGNSCGQSSFQTTATDSSGQTSIASESAIAMCAMEGFTYI